MTSEKEYSSSPDNSDIIEINESSSSIGAIRIDDTDDKDVLDIFTEREITHAVGCSVNSSEESSNGWQLVGIKEGNSFKQDQLTFDDAGFSTKALCQIMDASCGTIKTDGSFPHTESKCQSFALSAAQSLGELSSRHEDGCRWLCEKHSNDDLASLFVGFDGVHPWGTAGPNRYGLTLDSNLYPYYGDDLYTNIHIRNIGSFASTPEDVVGIPKLSADYIWVEDSLSLFSDQDELITITEDKVTINATVATRDGSHHKIQVDGLVNEGARGEGFAPCKGPSAGKQPNGCEDGRIYNKLSANISERSACAGKVIEEMRKGGFPDANDSFAMRVGTRG